MNDSGKAMSMDAMWLDEPAMYISTKSHKNEMTEKASITGWRRTEHADLERIGQFVRMKTYDIFGDIIPANVFETAVLSLVQINENDEVVSHVSLCNYPNIPSVPPYDWLGWIGKHYGMRGINERNALFVHLLVWDTRYNNDFFKRLLDTVFLCSIHTTHVVLIMPPWVTPVDIIEEQMTRIVPCGENDTYRVQALYVSLRHMHCPRLKIRRVVEEDNDDIIPIIDKETERLKELYGEFYISEMMRYPDGLRQLVVAETDGLATGVLCLNKTVDIESLNEHYELGPYFGLRKPDVEDDYMKSPSLMKSVSEILFPKEAKKIQDEENTKIQKEPDTHKVTLTNVPSSAERCTCNDSEVPPCPVCFPLEKLVVVKSVVFSSLELRSGIEDTTRRDSEYTPHDIEKHVSIAPVVEVVQTDPPTTDNVQYVGVTEMDLVIPIIPLDANDPTEPLHLTSSVNMPNVPSGFQSKLRSSVFAEAISGVPRRSIVGTDIAMHDTKTGDNYGKAVPIPKYYGEVNAFTLELFSMQDDVDERLAYDYLEAAFECFPEQDYCVALIPPSFPTFPFLQNFVRVPLRFNKDYPLVMYIAHRAAIVGNLKSRVAVPYDRIAIEILLRGIPNGDVILSDFDVAVGGDAAKFDTAVRENKLYCYVFLCEEVIIGLALLSVETEIDFIRSHYHIDDFISFENLTPDSHARITHMVMMPIFAPFHRFFFRELMRLGEFCGLYHRLYRNDASELTRTEPLATLLGEMIPVAPRRQIVYTPSNYDDNQPPDRVLRTMREKFALFMMVPRIAIIAKIEVNTRVIVVGASDCGLALIESLAFGPNAYSVNFTNLTLVSPDGIPFEKAPNDLEHDMILYKGRYCHSYRHLLGSRAWINVVHGTVSSINRKDKFVNILDLGNLSYDYLVLTCGLQYHRPKFAEQLEAEKRGELQEYETPPNCITVNNESDAARCLNFCDKLVSERPSSVLVVYGHNVDCYCALAVLLRTRVKGTMVTLIEPIPQMCESHDATFFNDTEIDTAVMNAVKESGVTTLAGWEIVDWKLAEVNGARVITTLVVESKTERKELPCDALINFREKTINTKTFMAICRAGLVFDGELVIDPEFRTNDPYIFAAGTITKYSRRFYADESSHKYKNRIEVGERNLISMNDNGFCLHTKLGKKLRDMMDPSNAEGEPLVTPASKLDMMLPVFKMPIVVYCKLPGDYRYLNVRKPGKVLPIDVRVVQQHGDVLITGSYASSIGYFRLRMNGFNAVESITCLTKNELEVENLITLYGKHDALLNDLKMRFQKSLVPDLYAYFRESWAVALFYDRFDCLRVENRATLVSPTVILSESLTQDCLKSLIKSRWDALPEQDREWIDSRYAGSVYQEELESCLIDFLQYGEDHLPMYCNPRQLRHMLDEINESPLFYPQ